MVLFQGGDAALHIAVPEALRAVYTSSSAVVPDFAVQDLSFLPGSHGSTECPRSRTKVQLFNYSRRINVELHDGERTPWSLKRAPALGLKNEGEMLFLHQRSSVSPPRGLGAHDRAAPRNCSSQRGKSCKCDFVVGTI